MRHLHPAVAALKGLSDQFRIVPLNDDVLNESKVNKQHLSYLKDFLWAFHARRTSSEPKEMIGNPIKVPVFSVGFCSSRTLRGDPYMFYLCRYTS